MSTKTEIVPGLFRLEEIDGTRLLCQFLLVAGPLVTVVDAGLPTSPWQTIVPAVHELGLDPEALTLVLTHPDADHCGGTASLRAAFPQVEVVAHAADSPPLGNPDETVAQRYDTFAQSDHISLDRLARARIVGRLGASYEVDTRLTDDRWFEFGSGRAAITHLPGHSHGHLGVWVPDERALVAGDAVMGYGIRNIDGSLLYPPQFLSRSKYEATLDRLEALNLEHLLCAHEPPMQGAAVAEFLKDSREAVRLLEANVRAALASGAETLAEICEGVHQRYPGLPAGRAPDLAPSTVAILHELQARGTVESDSTGAVRRFRLQPSKGIL